MVYSVLRCTRIGYPWRVCRPLFQFAVTVSIFTLTRVLLSSLRNLFE